MTNPMVSEINVSAIISTFVYLDYQNDDFYGKSLDYIMDHIPASVRNDEDYKGTYEALEEALRSNPELGKLELVSQSMLEGTDPNDVIACAFKDPSDKNLYVSYRGTGDGKWVDNGYGIANESSPMQEVANEYFENLVENNDLVQYDGKIILTGHSKGGNEAQYVTLNSKYGDLINNCYSIDGQGFSQEAIDHFKEQYGEEYYQQQLEKMYSINGENDFVHDLGNVVIPEDHTYFIKTPDVGGFADYHNIIYMLDGGELNWFTDSDGNIIKGEQGYIGELAKEISRRMMKLDPNDIEGCALAIMSILEVTLSYDDKFGGNHLVGSGDIKFASLEDFWTLIVHGGPIIAQTLFETKEGFNLFKGILEDAYKDNFFKGLAMSLIGIPLVGFAYGTYHIVKQVVITTKAIIEKIKNISDKIRNFANDLADCIIDFYNKGKNWFNENFNSGYKEATRHPSFKLDTEKMRTYADRLSKVNSRITKVDRRLDSLYWKVGLFDLWNLMQADLLTGYSVRVLACATALDNTASDYEKNENKLKNTL